MTDGEGDETRGNSSGTQEDVRISYGMMDLCFTTGSHAHNNSLHDCWLDFYLLHVNNSTKINGAHFCDIGEIAIALTQCKRSLKKVAITHLHSNVQPQEK